MKQCSISLLALAMAALALASCSTRRPSPPPPPTPPSPLGQQSSAPVGAATFVATAGSIDLFVVRACDLALERSRDARLRAVAAELRDDHRGLAAQLSMAGRRLDALPGARLRPAEDAELGQLRAAAPFEPAFMAAMKSAHRRSLALHLAFAARGSSATLRPVAANGAAVERRHSALLRAL